MVIEGGRRVEERRQGFHVEPREVRVAAERVLVEAPRWKRVRFRRSVRSDNWDREGILELPIIEPAAAGGNYLTRRQESQQTFSTVGVERRVRG